MTARITVVVPAHDEEAIIAGTLRRLLADDAPVDVIVVSNGCTDRTAANARAVRADVRVVEIAEPSKVAALNAGLDLAVHHPVAFVDADVSVSGADLVELASRLDRDERAQGASLTMRVAPSRSWWVRQYYRVWALTDYRRTGHLGSGLYMLSEAGCARLGRFPDVIADDLFVQRLLRPEERLVAPDLFFEVGAPGSLPVLFRRSARIAAGNRELVRAFPRSAPPTGAVGARSLLGRVWRRPRLWVGFAVYASVYSLAQVRGRAMLASQHPVAWNRDETTRQGVR